MTVSEAIARAKQMRQGAIDFAQYLKWVNVIEGRVQTEIMNIKLQDIKEYTKDDGDEQLLIPHPYDEVYIYYLCAMVDFFNEEIDLYMTDSQFFEEKFNDFKRAYSREHGTAGHQIHGWWRA